MTDKWQQLMDRTMSKERQQASRNRARTALAEVCLAELRRALELTQEEVADTLGRNQSAIAALEHRSDMLLSTLRRYVHAMGGEIEVVVHIPERQAVRIKLPA